MDTDANVHFMDRCITDGGVVDVYVNYEDNGVEDGQDRGLKVEKRRNKMMFQMKKIGHKRTLTVIGRMSMKIALLRRTWSMKVEKRRSKMTFL